jgi:hypothetical protein
VPGRASERARPRVLVAAEDPGAANALAPVVGMLSRDGRVEVSSACGPMAASVFERFAVPSFAESACDADGWLDRFAPALLLLGTSENRESVDRRLHRQARRRGIPTVCLLDYWSQFAQRFSEAGPDGHLGLVPDRIFVMDEPARDALIAEGVPPERLDVTGHPYLDYFQQSAPTLRPADAAAFRASLGLASQTRLITFVSETFGFTCGEDARFEPLSTSRERTIVVLEHLLAALARIVPGLDQEVALVNKLHPKNTAGEFASVPRRSLPFTMHVLTDADNTQLLQASALVIGMTSMLLVEAACLGLPTLSILARPADDSIGPGRRAHGVVVRSPEELHTELARLLHGRTVCAAASPGAPHRGATRRVVDRLYYLVDRHAGNPGIDDDAQ